MKITETELRDLESGVKGLMEQGRWMDAIDKIRSLARRKHLDPDLVTRGVIRIALELGHVQPLVQLDG